MNGVALQASLHWQCPSRVPSACCLHVRPSVTDRAVQCDTHSFHASLLTRGIGANGRRLVSFNHMLSSALISNVARPCHIL